LYAQGHTITNIDKSMNMKLLMNTYWYVDEDTGMHEGRVHRTDSTVQYTTG
jgi:hypothetical protein